MEMQAPNPYSDSLSLKGSPAIYVLVLFGDSGVPLTLRVTTLETAQHNVYKRSGPGDKEVRSPR
jgi:hypothetical protein